MMQLVNRAEAAEVGPRDHLVRRHAGAAGGLLQIGAIFAAVANRDLALRAVGLVIGNRDRADPFLDFIAIRLTEMHRHGGE